MVGVTWDQMLEPSAEGSGGIEPHYEGGGSIDTYLKTDQSYNAAEYGTDTAVYSGCSCAGGPGPYRT